MDDYNLWQLGVVAVFVGYLVWRWRRRPAGPDIEVTIVLHTAAQNHEDGEIGISQLLRAACCSPGIAAAFDRTGVDVDAFTQNLDLGEASNRAAVNAARRGEDVYSIVDLLRALDVGIVLDDTLVATIVDAGGPPSASFIYFWNDRVTPMREVISVLSEVFDCDSYRAPYIMLTVHHRGYATLGPYDEETAERLLTAARDQIRAKELRLQVRRVAPDTSEWRMTDHGLVP